jgi:hypothetical protein
MSRIVDLTGRKFGRWSVDRLSHQTGKVLFWHCRCDCGTERAVFGGDLKRGRSTSCGCYMREQKAVQSTVHGHSHHPVYRTWVGMKTRCECEEVRSYHLYGGRGIAVCERWSKSFKAFFEDFGHSWSPGMSIDRIDGDRGYEPGNVRWASPREQANNRRTNRIINTPKGEMNVTEAAREFGLSSFTLFARIRYGWDEADLLLPLQKRKRSQHV